MCGLCPRVVCRLCLQLPPDLETSVLQEDISFRCVCCHIKMDQPGAYFVSLFVLFFLFVHASLLTVFLSHQRRSCLGQVLAHQWCARGVRASRNLCGARSFCSS